VIKKLITIIKEAQGKWSLEDKVAAAKALGAMGEFTPVPFLTAIWQNQELDDELRTSAAKAIKDSETPISFEMIEAFLRDPDTAIRRVGIEILDKHDNQTHINLLLFALQDSDPYIRRHALIRANESGSTIPINILQPLLYDKDEKVSYYAWFYLQASCENASFERWLEALQHEYAVIHNLTLKIIEHHKDQFPVEPILAILSHHTLHTNTQHEMRLSCIKALELLGERVPPEPLLKLLEDPNKHIQSQALTVLAKRNIRISADSLLSMLDDVTTGKAAAENLASMGSEAPITAILEIAQSHRAKGPNYAFYALRLLANYVPTKAILPFLQQEKILDYYHGDYWELVQLLQAQDIEIPFEQLMLVLHEKLYDKTITTQIVASLARTFDL
jgi:HEAT repeat protein